MCKSEETKLVPCDNDGCPYDGSAYFKDGHIEYGNMCLNCISDYERDKMFDFDEDYAV